MTKTIFKLLEELCVIPGPVGREDPVQDYVQDALQRFTPIAQRDKLGNLTVTLPGKDEHFAVVAHADEVGFFVSNIDENGFLRAKWNTQGYKPDFRLLPGQHILLLTESGKVPGYFCVKTAHIAGPTDKKRIPKWDEIFIDVGASSAEEVKQLGIEIGTPAVYDSGIGYLELLLRTE